VKIGVGVHYNIHEVMHNNGWFQFHGLHFLPLKMKKKWFEKKRMNCYAIRRQLSERSQPSPLHSIYIDCTFHQFSFFNNTTNNLIILVYHEFQHNNTTCLMFAHDVLFYVISSASTRFERGWVTCHFISS